MNTVEHIERELRELAWKIRCIFAEMFLFFYLSSDSLFSFCLWNFGHDRHEKFEFLLHFKAYFTAECECVFWNFFFFSPRFFFLFYSIIFNRKSYEFIFIHHNFRTLVQMNSNGNKSWKKVCLVSSYVENA